MQKEKMLNRGNDVDLSGLGGVSYVAFTITRSCNYKCIHCFNESGPVESYELSNDELMNIANQICELKPVSVCLCGGETMLRESIIYELIQKLSTQCCMVNMVTNGYFITEEVSKKLKSSGLNMLQISLDGHNEFEHDNMRGIEGAFSKAINAITYAKEVGLDVAVSFVPQKINYRNVIKTMDLCFKLGVSDFRVMPLIPMGRGGFIDDLLLTSEEYIQLQDSIVKNKYQYENQGMHVEWGDPIDHLYRMPNNALKKMDTFSMDISAEGKLLVSTYLPIIVGDSKKHSLLDYWNNGYKNLWANKKVLKLISSIKTIYDFNDFEPAPYTNEVIDLEFIK